MPSGEILDAVCLNRTLSDVSLVTEKRKPFDVLAKRPNWKKSRGDCRIFEPFVPEQLVTAFAQLVMDDRNLASQVASIESVFAGKSMVSR